MQRQSSMQFWAVVLIGLGAIFLIANLMPNAWSLVCPLALIGLGLFLLFGRSLTIFNASDVQTERFVAPIEGAQAADIDIGFSVDAAHVHAAGDADKLIDATVTHVGEMDFSVSGEAERVIRLRQKSGYFLGWFNPANWFHAPMNLGWEVGLSPDVPMTLAISGGVGHADLGLHDLNVTDLRVSGGAGAINVTLPASSAGYTASVSGGMGSVNVDVPDGAVMGLRLIGGMGAIRLRIGDGAAVNAHITGGAGQVTVDLARDAAVSLKAESGLGSISVPPHFVQLAGETHVVGQSGAWATPGFGDAERPIVIEFIGGMGGLAVR